MRTDETESDNYDPFDQIGINETDKLRPGVPEVFQIEDGSDIEKTVTTTYFMTAQEAHPYYKDIGNDVRNRYPSIPVTTKES